MPRNYLVTVALVLAALAEPAMGELRGSPDGSPSFSPAETQIIARNAALTSLVQSEPWLVRRLLDALAANPSNTAAGGRAADGPNETAIDPQLNPDLDRLQRASPEAALDLFQLLKQAAPAKPQPVPKKN